MEGKTVLRFWSRKEIVKLVLFVLDTGNTFGPFTSIFSITSHTHTPLSCFYVHKPYLFLIISHLILMVRWKTHKWRRCRLVPWSIRQDSPGAQETCGPGLQFRGRKLMNRANTLLFRSSLYIFVGRVQDVYFHAVLFMLWTWTTVRLTNAVCCEDTVKDIVL